MLAILTNAKPSIPQGIFPVWPLAAKGEVKAAYPTPLAYRLLDADLS
jgi:hypothetical protein